MPIVHVDPNEDARNRSRGLDISVEEPIQHVIIHTFTVNLKNVNMLDLIRL